MSQMSHCHQDAFDKGAVRNEIWCDLVAGLQHWKRFSHSHIFELTWNAKMLQANSLQADSH